MRMKNFIAILLIVPVTACTRDAALTARDKERVAEEVRETLLDYFGAIKQEGLMAEFKYLDNSKDFYWVPPGYGAAITYDSVAAVLTKAAPRYTSVDNTWDTLQIDALSMNLARYTGRLRSVMRDTSGNVSAHSLAESGIAIRRDDGWKLLSGHTSVNK